MRSILKAVAALFRAAWHIFAATCILAGGLADGPGLLEVLGTSGFASAIARMAGAAMQVITSEPLGFLALVIGLALAAERVRPMVDRLRRWMAEEKPQP